MQNSTNLKQYYATCFSLIAGIMLFGGLLAPTVSSTTLEDCQNTVDENWIKQILYMGLIMSICVYMSDKVSWYLHCIGSLFIASLLTSILDLKFLFGIWMSLLPNFGSAAWCIFGLEHIFCPVNAIPPQLLCLQLFIF